MQQSYLSDAYILGHGERKRGYSERRGWTAIERRGWKWKSLWKTSRKISLFSEICAKVAGIKSIISIALEERSKYATCLRAKKVRKRNFCRSKIVAKMFCGWMNIHRSISKLLKKRGREEMNQLWREEMKRKQEKGREGDGGSHGGWGRACCTRGRGHRGSQARLRNLDTDHQSRLKLVFCTWSLPSRSYFLPFLAPPPQKRSHGGKEIEFAKEVLDAPPRWLFSRGASNACWLIYWYVCVMHM